VTKDKSDLAAIRTRKLHDIDVTLAEGVKLVRYEARLGFIGVGAITIAVAASTMLFAYAAEGPPIPRIPLAIILVALGAAGTLAIAFVNTRMSAWLGKLGIELNQRQQSIDDEYETQARE
jgi:CHASE2 domain-containing sensor protein